MKAVYKTEDRWLQLVYFAL